MIKGEEVFELDGEDLLCYVEYYLKKRRKEMKELREYEKERIERERKRAEREKELAEREFRKILEEVCEQNC